MVNKKIGGFLLKLIMEPIKFLKAIYFWMTKNHGFMVAIATIVLAGITYFHIREAQKMRNVTKEMAVQTKRLADISIKQFKIKSYPTFLIEAEKPFVKSSILFQKYKITNKGDITAFKVTSFLMNVHRKQNGGQFFDPLNATTYWMGEERRRTLDNEIKIPRGEPMSVETRKEVTDENSLDNLLYVLLFIRFEVPYDDKFSYETHGFTLRELDEGDKQWQKMNPGDTKRLVSDFREYFEGWPKSLKTFLKDYKIN